MTNTIVSALGTVFEPVVKYFKAVQTEHALSALSDDLLRDIGIERAQISAIAKSAPENEVPKFNQIGATLVVLHADKPAVNDQHELKLAA